MNYNVSSLAFVWYDPVTMTMTVIVFLFFIFYLFIVSFSIVFIINTFSL